MAQSSTKFAYKVPIILRTPTTDWAIAALKESEIDKLATLWACVREHLVVSCGCSGFHS